MRIAINASIVDPFLSGLGIYTVEVTRELAKLCEDVIVYSAEGGCCGGSQARWRKISCGVQPCRGRTAHLRRLIWLQTMLPLRLTIDRATVLFSPVPEGMLLPIVPQVIVVHDVLPLRFPQEYPRQQYYFRHLVPAVLRRARAIIAVSECTRADLVAFYRLPPSKIRVIPNGLDGRRYRADIATEIVRRTYRLESYLLYVGNLLPHKNLTALLQAFAIIAGGLPHRLVIAGKRDPRYYPSLELTMQRLGLRDRVLFLDYVPAEELPALYAAADACIVPSLYEGFGLPVIEAMACGTPVVASRAGSLPEVAGDAAMLIDPGDVPGMATALQAVLGDSEVRAALHQKGLEQAAKYSWRRTATRVLEVLQTVGS